MSLSDKFRCATTGKSEKCEGCGAEFTCGPLWSCWCMREKVPAQALTELKKKYDRCLCPDCLRRAAEAASGSKG